MSDETFYLTTPIYYVNATPHLAHAYTTILADTMARFQKLRLGPDRVYFLTGTDEHGDKIAQAAARAGESPQAYADRISGIFQETWKRLGLTPNQFIRTTSTPHKQAVQRFLQQIYDSGDIYFGEYGGHYCFGCERFYTEKELEDGRCPDHQKEPTFIKEENYFFRMGKYQEWLIDYIHGNPDFIRPERYKNEVLAFLKDSLEDLCISRPRARLTWGIPLPFDDQFVTYVWFDALINYISALGWPDGEHFRRFWPSAQHLIGKDILKPHAIYWPTMLKAAGIQPFRHLNVHGYWKIEESKMSKSLGKVVAPLELADEGELSEASRATAGEVTAGMERFAFSEALGAIWNLVSATNKYLVIHEPWKREPTEARTQTVLFTAAETVRKIAVLLYPFLPQTAERMLKGLGIDVPLASIRLEDALGFGWRDRALASRIVEEVPALFPRIQVAAQKLSKEANRTPAMPETLLEQITIEEFRRIDLRVAEVVEAAAIPGSAKLVRLRVRIKDEERTIVAGLREQYALESWSGKRIILVANLKPTTLMGIRSQGMVLAAEDNTGKIVLLTPEHPISPGSKVR